MGEVVLKYAASTIIYLGKKKEKDGTEVVEIYAETHKSRLSKENKCRTQTQIQIRLTPTMVSRIGREMGVFKNGNRFQIGEAKVYPKNIYENPEKYFTPEVMQALDECAKKEYSYGA